MKTAPQATWRWQIAAYLFLAGTGAGAFIVGVVSDFKGYTIPAKIAITFGVPIVAFSTIFLILDLGHPEKFFRAMLHPGTSWISRGVFILSGLIVFGGLTVILWVWPFSGVLNANPGHRAVLEVISLVFALATCIYTGILIGIVVSRPFWNNPLLPMLFLVSALSTGIGGVFFITPIVSSVLGIASAQMAGYMTYLESVDMILIIIEAIAMYLYMTMVFSRAPEAVNLLIKGKLSGLFWGGFVGIGLLVPLCVEYLASTMLEGAMRSLVTLVAGVLLLLGGFLMRQLILAAGIRSPLMVRAAFSVRPGV
jgi:polysulfide reductase chain C